MKNLLHILVFCAFLVSLTDLVSCEEITRSQALRVLRKSRLTRRNLDLGSDSSSEDPDKVHCKKGQHKEQYTKNKSKSGKMKCKDNGKCKYKKGKFKFKSKWHCVSNRPNCQNYNEFMGSCSQCLDGYDLNINPSTGNYCTMSSELFWKWVGIWIGIIAGICLLAGAIIACCTCSNKD